MLVHLMDSKLKLRFSVPSAIGSYGFRKLLGCYSGSSFSEATGEIQVS